MDLSLDRDWQRTSSERSMLFLQQPLCMTCISSLFPLHTAMCLTTGLAKESMPLQQSLYSSATTALPLGSQRLSTTPCSPRLASTTTLEVSCKPVPHLSLQQYPATIHAFVLSILGQIACKQTSTVAYGLCGRALSRS